MQLDNKIDRNYIVIFEKSCFEYIKKLVFLLIVLKMTHNFIYIFTQAYNPLLLLIVPDWMGSSLIVSTDTTIEITNINMFQ